MIKNLLTGLSVLMAHACWAADSYDSLNNQLTIPYVNAGEETYSNVVATVGKVIEVKGGKAPPGADTYDFTTNQLKINEVQANGNSYTNVTVTINSVLSVQKVLDKSNVWVEQLTQEWRGQNLEGSIASCTNRSIRWIAPISGFDINNDGMSEFILPISCYQGSDPKPGEKHNRQVIAAWKLFCSKPDKSYYDCTNERFGSSVINATGTDSGGGNPYIHVMEQPFDINNDGYPDIWYALNRDDGRPGFDFNNSEDVKLLTQFCGPLNGWEWDCTRKSNQSVLLSQPNGTYKVAFMPWEPTNTNAMVMLPNIKGTYDALSFNYGQWRAARLQNNIFIDVTEEYKKYTNIDIVGFVEPYVKSFTSNGITYLATTGIPAQYTNPDILSKNGSWGFTLWKWNPGSGFVLSDYYTPNENNNFIYNEKIGNSIVKRYGTYINGVPTFTPRWHFFNFAKINPNEDPVLIVSQESGSTVGDYFKARVSPDAVYSWYNYNNSDIKYQIYEISAVESFYINNGKITPTNKSVIDGDAVWNVPSLIFEDINNDGYLDAIGVTGHQQHGQIFINDRNGLLRKIYTKNILPSMSNSDDSYKGGFGWTIRNFGEKNKFSLLYWGEGFPTLPDWAGNKYTVPDLKLLKSDVPIDSMPVHTVQKIQSQIQTCLRNLTWIDQCEFK